MNKMKLFFITTVMLAMMIVLVACNGKISSSSKEGNGSGGSNTVNIGFSGPLSGPAAYYGERTLNGLKLAAEEINNSGGFEVNGKNMN
ncbi:branched-chain amino acid transport system substrate-binding protein [Parageobacillus thermantarcticus]|uniref:Branched-chain amino acid transport system substrate-binding protein n=1 Tax=Parageobacillus thermantarcticus TaxID=186116 RepID=A0A1I0TRV1_9BACL|nr:branched-chain amino acid transport system substrate-binding protein [Parageobacillus thermantarcticus]